MRTPLIRHSRAGGNPVIAASEANTTRPSFPRRREPSHHSHSTGFPPARERLIGGFPPARERLIGVVREAGVVHGASVVHGAGVVREAGVVHGASVVHGATHLCCSTD